MSPAAIGRRHRVVLVAVDGLAVGDDVARRLAEAPALVHAAQARVERLLGRTLKRRVERRVDGEAALVQALGAVALFEMLAHVLHEERREAAGVGRPAVTTGDCLALAACSREM